MPSRAACFSAASLCACMTSVADGGSPFEWQYLLGHHSLEMTKRYCQSLGFEDSYQAHVKASPIDNLNKRIRA